MHDLYCIGHKLSRITTDSSETRGLFSAKPGRRSLIWFLLRSVSSLVLASRLCRHSQRGSPERVVHAGTSSNEAGLSDVLSHSNAVPGQNYK